MENQLLSLLGGLFSSSESADGGAIQTRNAPVNSGDYDYQIYVPAKIESGQKLPVIVFLHGIRERGNGGLVPTGGAFGKIIQHYFAQIPALILLPQCRPGKYWSDAAMDEMVMRALEQTIEEFAADASRVYLIGVSMGGYGVWHFASQYPGKFAALVSICGGSSITNGDRFSTLAEKVGKTPAWLFHGADDRIVPAEESRQIAAALKTNDGNVKYSEYAGVGHNVWLNVLSEKELLPWLLKQSLE
ncbi:MAG: alpha/beta fold hydrolase [Pyrinomonadaceae bacterium]